jgi:glycosyltransferase involved in cell wall biosynthesis
MRVTIDAVPLLVRSAGVKNYLYYWIQALEREAGDVAIELFPYLSRPDVLDHEISAANPLSTYARLGALFLLNRFPNDLAGWMTPQTDVFHTCKLLNPPRRAKLTATVHDLTCWLLPEPHSPRNVAADKVFAERILRRADGIIAVSEATRQDAVRILGLPPERIRVIHHGVAPAFFEVGPEDGVRVRERYGLKLPYLLFVGAIEPRKNLDVLLNAHRQLPASLREEVELVVAGPMGWARRETLERLRSPDRGVRYIGYVAEEDLPGLFSAATAFVYPSLYEGFGFPVVQAMAAGVPVITSNVSSLPEVSGGAAVLVDPRSEAELSRAIHDVLTSPSLRQELASRGRIGAKRFTWEECARRSLEFFAQVAG